MIIKVLGVGCGSCKKLEQNVDEAVKVLGIDAKVQKIEDIQEISSHGIMSVPALMVNDNVLSIGKVLSINEIKELLSDKKNCEQARKIVNDGSSCACGNK